MILSVLNLSNTVFGDSDSRPDLSTRNHFLMYAVVLFNMLSAEDVK